MTVQLDFNGFLFLVITIVIVWVGFHLVKILKQVSETLKIVGKVVDQSELEIKETIKHVEKITDEVGNISGHVSTITEKAEAVSGVATKVVQAVMNKL